MTKLRFNLKKKLLKSNDSYDAFEKINGRHPLRSKTFNTYVDYPARTRHGGKVAIFNFSLAKTMGLIPKDHVEKMNSELEKKLLDTFALVIINEYDNEHNREFPEEEIRKNKYMATRYLQLQHPNKQGKTSGDGRSIWNGTFKSKGVTWDLSSCGTGATCLSPATHILGRYFETGDPSISYGCGYSEIDEGFASIFFSEVLHKNHVPTERVLGVIEFEKGLSITIRAHTNLIRPSHLFRFLKLGDYEGLEAMANYYIDRQKMNGDWKDVPEGQHERYRYFLRKETEAFARVAAKFEDEYIFCWMDWDGDNVLMDGGIIDYGSVRQFGLFHAEYRYDDDNRYSTSILEQKKKAKYTVQVFAQLTDYLITGEKKVFKDFVRDKSQNEFEKIFWQAKYENFLFKLGFSFEECLDLLKSKIITVKKFHKIFTYFERAKSSEGIVEVADGITQNAIFCMRDILRELPQLYLSRGEDITSEEFIEILRSSYAKDSDVLMSNYRKEKISKFQKYYWELVKKVSTTKDQTLSQTLLSLTMRSSIINKYDRVTGDSITTIIGKILNHSPRFTVDKVHEVLDHFREYQNLDPDGKKPIDSVWESSRFMRGILEIVKDYREGL
jgi:hypothetical protein